jgi:hypothetical protein
MWIVKGVSLGTAFFLVGTIVFLFLTVFSPIESNKATGLSAITGVTTQNPFFWAALVACLVLGVCLVASWPVRKPLEPSELKEEAARLAKQLEKQSAGRVVDMTIEDREEAAKNLEKYYEDKRQFYSIVGGKPAFIHRSLHQKTSPAAQKRSVG